MSEYKALIIFMATLFFIGLCAALLGHQIADSKNTIIKECKK